MDSLDLPVEFSKTRHSDERGYFQERFSGSDYRKYSFRNFVQENTSVSRLGVVRGWHWQLPPFAQEKLVTCFKGRVLDACLDIRVQSPSFGQIYTFELSPKTLNSVWIPIGFAHAFQALEEDSMILYSVTAEYNLENSRTICPLDDTLPIQWPIQNVILSKKDTEAPLMRASPPEELFNF